MTKNINLLQNKKVGDTYQEKLLQTCKRFATVFLLGTAGSSLLFFFLTLNPSAASLKQQESTLLTNLSFTQERVAKYLFIKDRLSTIQKIINTRYPIATTLIALQKELPDDVHISTLTIENKTFSIILSSNSLLSLQRAFANIDSLLQNKKIIKKMILQTISANHGFGSYTLSLHGELL